MLKKIIVTLLILATFFCMAIPVSASESFSRADVPGGVTEIRLSREMYIPTKELTSSKLNLEEQLVGITDICSDNKGNILLLCGEDSRLVRVSSNFSFGEEIEIRDVNNQELNFKGAKGIFYSTEGNIYITDTENARIIITDNNGVVKEILETPKSDLLPDNFIYQPSAIAKDKQGFTYILSLGCYYGALLYSPDNEFLGFFGANTTETSALDTLAFLWDKLTSTEQKKRPLLGHCLTRLLILILT